jgi:hypothetical protein
MLRVENQHIPARYEMRMGSPSLGAVKPLRTTGLVEAQQEPRCIVVTLYSLSEQSPYYHSYRADVKG